MPSQFRVVDAAVDVVTGYLTEIILVTNVSGTTWTVTRGAEGTTPQAHALGWLALPDITAGGLTNGFVTDGGETFLPLSGGTMTGPVAGFSDEGGQVFNITAYGVGVGTGSVSVDTAAIAAANAAAHAGAGGIVYFPPPSVGYYFIDSTQNITKTSVSWKGAGCSSVIIYSTVAGGGVGLSDMIRVQMASFVPESQAGSITGMTLDGTYSDAYGCGIHYGDVMNGGFDDLIVQHFNGTVLTGYTLSSALSTSVPISSLSVTGSGIALAGQPIMVHDTTGGYTGDYQVFTTTGASASASTLPLQNTWTPGYNFHTGSTISVLTGRGIRYDNETDYCEGSEIDRTYLYANAVGMSFEHAGSGTGSFGYTRIKKLRIGVNTGQVGMWVQSTASIYNSELNISENCNGIGIQIDGASTIQNSYCIQMENDAPAGVGLSLAAAAVVTGDGLINCYNGTMANYAASAATFEVNGSCFIPGFPGPFVQPNGLVAAGGMIPIGPGTSAGGVITALFSQGANNVSIGTGNPGTFELYCNTSGNPLTHYFDQDGNVSVVGSCFAADGIYTSNSTSTAGPRLWGGIGAPSGALGAQGDAYLRSDTPSTTNQRLYMKTGTSTWTGIV